MGLFELTVICVALMSIVFITYHVNCRCRRSEEEEALYGS